MFIPLVIKKAVKKIIFSLYDKYNFDFKKYDSDTLKIIKKLGGNAVCIDIGCSKGEVLDVIIKYNPNTIHYAFEPLPDYARKLKIKYSKNAFVYDFALSDIQKEVEYNYVISNPEYSGLKKRTYRSQNEEIKIIKVRTEMLDNLIPEKTKIDFIKIDVEGAEYFVLKGAINTIKRNKPIIVFEFGLGAADYYDVKPDMIFDLLNKAGLKVSLMEYYLLNQPPLDKYDFNSQFNNCYNYYFIAYP